MGWDGRRWRIEPTPDPDPANDALRADNALAGVSCTSSKLCVAVGEYNPSSFSPDGIHTVPVVMPVAERWNGVRWSMLTFPSLPSGAPAGGLSAVSCTSSRVCMAVGSSTDFSPLIVFAERWDGTSWSVQSTPNAPGEYNDLSGVSCTSSRACTAVGDANHQQPLVERWDGTSWSLERTPNAGGTRLTAVSCTSSAICTAVSNTVRGNDVAEQSASASAKLNGIPVPCASARFTLRVTGIGISSVAWSLDSKRLTGHSVDRATRYVASVRLSPGRHKLTVRVKFTASSQAHARTFRRSVLGCSPTR
jgi:hypothetical protein